jgi:transposase
MFILHYVQGYKHREIAEIFECSEGNSKPQVRRARIRLRDLIQKALEDNTLQHRKSTAGSPRLAPAKTYVPSGQRLIQSCF